MKKGYERSDVAMLLDPRFDPEFDAHKQVLSAYGPANITYAQTLALNTESKLTALSELFGHVFSSAERLDAKRISGIREILEDVAGDLGRIGAALDGALTFPEYLDRDKRDLEEFIKAKRTLAGLEESDE